MRTGVAAAVAAAGSVGIISTASAAPSTVDWKPSPDKPEVDCGGTVTVPVDWSNPNGPTKRVAAVTVRGHKVPAKVITRGEGVGE
ncbi:hypothetical protein [Nonomuraea dietziae]|uniref:Uncharacterized protein n=1 Tax=Nonomuraea dietziae TaxID=65515 RepID=A0A7W5YUD3_9ACTN|nr:hypothetical protein [Nonomuraea dietziae]MBB3732954.1 hypothetical protein [Nonomuraea dietziae]